MLKHARFPDFLPDDDKKSVLSTGWVFAVLLSLLILNERFFWPFWLGAALVLGGVVIANRNPNRKKRKIFNTTRV